MNKYLKYTLFAAGGLAVLFATAIAVIVATVDPNSFKPLIVEQVKAKKQRTLTLAGDIKLSLFPKLGLDLGKAALSEHNSDNPFASVEHLKLGVAWLPLFKKELVVEQVIVDGAHASLVRYADGSTNFDDLMKKEEEDQKLKFDIDGIKITHSSVNFDDRMAKRKLAVSSLNATTGRIRNNVATHVEAGMDMQADRPQAALHARLQSGLTFDLDKKHYQLDGLDFEATGDAAGISGLDLALSGSVDANLQTLDITAEKIALTLKGKQSARQIDVKLDVPQLQMTKDKVSSGKIKLDGKFQQADGSMNAVATLAELSGTAHDFRALALAVEFDGKQGGNTLNGKLSSPLQGDLDSLQFDLPKIAATLAVANPKLPNGGFKANLGGDASASMKQENAHFNGTLAVDDSHINAKLAMQGFAQPKYTFDVDIDRLDADRYTAPKAAPQAAAPEKPFDLSALKTLNANGSLRIGSLTFSNVKTSNLRIGIKAANGHLEAAPVSANLYQGALSGSASVNAATSQFALKQKLSGINIGPLIKDAANKDILEGRGNVDVDVTAQGATVSAMKQSLNGNAALLLNDGAIKGINIAATLRNAKARLGALKGQQTQAANTQEKTDFTELKASFTLHHGVAHNDDLSAKSPLLRLSGNGDIDIGHSSMNYLAKATVVGSLEGQGGADSLKGITVPVRATGPFDALKYSLDFNALVGEAVKSKVEQKKEEIKTRLEEQLKGGLKGLFR